MGRERVCRVRAGTSEVAAYHLFKLLEHAGMDIEVPVQV